MFLLLLAPFLFLLLELCDYSLLVARFRCGGKVERGDGVDLEPRDLTTLKSFSDTRGLLPPVLFNNSASGRCPPVIHFILPH